jgi:hypothetical protein
MTEPIESRTHRLRSVAAARFLAEPRAHFLLMAFVPRPRTVGEVAKALDMPMLAAWRLARRAVELGLLETVAEQPRRGRSLKLYQAVASAFVIPDELMPRMPGDLLADELRGRIAQEMAARGSSHVIRADGEGNPLLEPLAAEGEGGLPFEAWRILRLSRTDAAALEAQIVALLDSYEDRQTPGAREWLVHAAMVVRRS